MQAPPARNAMIARIQMQIIPRVALLRWLVPTLIAALSLLTFLPALQNGFVDWDDDINFVNNPYYRGLGRPQLYWMFTVFYKGHYQPLSWMTLGLDYLLWGTNPFGYHLTNLLFHAANAVLFYFVALRLLSLARSDSVIPKETGLRVASGFAALFFAIHPLRVESVAWATERRDVLSGFFFLWTVLCYLRAATATDRSRRRWMAAAVIVYCLCLLAKVSGISLPVVLFVLDVYPLGRLGGGAGKWFGQAARGIWREKIPFLLPALAAGIVAPIAAHRAGAVPSFEAYPIAPRIAGAFFGLIFYLEKTVIPLRLSPLYEVSAHPNPWDWVFVLSGVAVAFASVSLFILRRRWPAGLAIWTAYGALLAPMLGLIQAGPQIVADRYSYLSCLGWAVLAGAGLLYFWKPWESGRPSRKGFAVATGLAAAILVGLGLTTWRQTRVWHDSESLFKHVVAVTDGSLFQSAIAHNGLGNALAGRGDLAGAIDHYRLALQINPLFELAHYNLALALAGRGDSTGAIEHYRLALQIDPSFELAHYNLALALAARGDSAAAIVHYLLALQINPLNDAAHTSLGDALADRGDFAGAVAHYRRALQINPLNDLARNRLAKVLAGRGESEQTSRPNLQPSIPPERRRAIESLRRALEERR